LSEIKQVPLSAPITNSLKPLTSLAQAHTSSTTCTHHVIIILAVTTRWCYIYEVYWAKYNKCLSTGATTSIPYLMSLPYRERKKEKVTAISQNLKGIKTKKHIPYFFE